MEVEDKIEVNLTGTAFTLLIPLASRALYTMQPEIPINDTKAAEIVGRLKFYFTNIAYEIVASKLFCLSRAYNFDTAIKGFLKENPEGVIIDLGAGLDTGFYRVDNGNLSWFDIDIPDVIKLRTKVLPPPDRVTYISKDVRDLSWIDIVKAKLKETNIKEKVFIIAGGFFQYLEKDDVKKIMLAIAELLPDSELIFDCPPEDLLQKVNQIFKLTSDLNDIEYKFGLDRGEELESWSPCIKVKSISRYFDKLTRECTLPIIELDKINAYNAVNNSKFYHLHLNKI